jgi:hypothetical protein
MLWEVVEAFIFLENWNGWGRLRKLFT